MSNDDHHSKPPLIDLATIEYLERIFPDRSPDPTMSIDKVWYAAGASAPARHLRMILNTQNENVLEKH